MEIIQKVPPEIWNKITFFSDNQDLIRILVYHFKIFRIDLLYLKRMYQRNIDEFKDMEGCMVLDIQPDYGIYLLDYASLYPALLFLKILLCKLFYKKFV